MNRKDIEEVINQNNAKGGYVNDMTLKSRYSRDAWWPSRVVKQPHQTTVVCHRVKYDRQGDAFISDVITEYSTRELTAHKTIRQLSDEKHEEISQSNMTVSMVQSSPWAISPIELADEVAKWAKDKHILADEDVAYIRERLVREHLYKCAERVIADKFDLKAVDVWYDINGWYHVRFDLSTPHLIALLTLLTVSDK